MLPLIPFGVSFFPRLMGSDVFHGAHVGAAIIDDSATALWGRRTVSATCGSDSQTTSILSGARGQCAAAT